MTGWTGCNPWVALCAITVALIAWFRTRRDAVKLRNTQVVAGTGGFAMGASCYVALVIQPNVRPAVGLGITVLGVAALVAITLTDVARTRNASQFGRLGAASRYAAVTIVCIALGMLGYVSPDDPPRDGVGGEYQIGKYRVKYELDDVGISLVVVMELPGDCSGVGFSRENGHHTETYSFRVSEPLTFRWTHGDAEIGATKYDLSRGRVLCLVADQGEVRSLQLPLQPRAINARSRFRWSHHGVEDEVRHLVGDAAVDAAMVQLRHG